MINRLRLKAVTFDNILKYNRLIVYSVQFANAENTTHNKLIQMMIAHQHGMGAQSVLKASPYFLLNILGINLESLIKITKAKRSQRIDLQVFQIKQKTR